MFSRRTILSAAGASLVTGQLQAASLLPTPRQASGPFFPDKLPAQTDTDLTSIGKGQAQGQVIEIVGRVLGADGRPIAGAIVDLWQANAFGRYTHSADRNSAPLDPNFQGSGVALSDELGRYRFRTIRPGLYPGRARHVHFAISGQGIERFTTQLYFAGEPGNQNDFLYRSLGTRAGALTAAFDADKSRGNVPVGLFDIVVDASE